MDTTAVKRAAGLQTDEADRLREDLDQLRREVARLSQNIGASASRRMRSKAAAARAGVAEAQQRALELRDAMGGKARARPLTITAALSVIGLLALAACLRMGMGEHRD